MRHSMSLTESVLSVVGMSICRSPICPTLAVSELSPSRDMNTTKLSYHYIYSTLLSLELWCN